MATYKIDETIVKTENASHCWEEEADWDGRNCISRATGSQWEHETLYRSKKGRYYIVHQSQWQGTLPYARWIDDDEAAAWLQLMGHEIPDDLAKSAEEISE